jgi:hypothetical protein
MLTHADGPSDPCTSAPNGRDRSFRGQSLVATAPAARTSAHLRASDDRRSFSAWMAAPPTTTFVPLCLVDSVYRGGASLRWCRHQRPMWYRIRARIRVWDRSVLWHFHHAAQGWTPSPWARQIASQCLLGNEAGLPPGPGLGASLAPVNALRAESLRRAPSSVGRMGGSNFLVLTSKSRRGKESAGKALSTGSTAGRAPAALDASRPVLRPRWVPVGPSCAAITVG